MENLVVIQDNQAVVSSRQVAGHFEKEHKHVLENIRGILRSAEIPANLFMENQYMDMWSRKQTEYLMTRDGFTLLAMGFTGAKALQWKLKYIAAFNEMEGKLQALPDFTNPVIAARAWADAMEGKQLAEAEVKCLAPKAEVYDAFVDHQHAVGFRELAKELQVKEATLREFLKKNRIAYHRNNKWKPYAEMIEKGYMIVKDIRNKSNGYAVYVKLKRDQKGVKTQFKNPPPNVRILCKKSIRGEYGVDQIE